ncbi:MAG TPA: ferric iron uptake transcriptional regulator [Polyangiales bacterium]|nr:ferric iron uptake transcriptional regulator [Polyangiales bacterium]
MASSPVEMRPADKLSHVGLKVTTPRLKVLHIFQTHERHHLTAEDVHRGMLDQKSDIGLATVYRVLGQLTDVGILSRNVFESGKAVYELQRGEHHDHLICLECGRVDEFSDDVIEERQRSIAEASGYALAQHQLALYGYCPACRERKTKRQ